MRACTATTFTTFTTFTLFPFSSVLRGTDRTL